MCVCEQKFTWRLCLSQGFWVLVAQSNIVTGDCQDSLTPHPGHTEHIKYASEVLARSNLPLHFPFIDPHSPSHFYRFCMSFHKSEDCWRVALWLQRQHTVEYISKVSRCPLRRLLKVFFRGKKKNLYLLLIGAEGRTDLFAGKACPRQTQKAMNEDWPQWKQ